MMSESYFPDGYLLLSLLSAKENIGSEKSRHNDFVVGLSQSTIRDTIRILFRDVISDPKVTCPECRD